MWSWLVRVGNWVADEVCWVLADETGGGSQPQPPQVIPAPAAPDYGETAGDVAKARLEYDPQLTKQQYDLSAQYGPLYKALTEQMFPQLPIFSQQVMQQLQSPSGLTPEQQAAQDAIRGRAFQQSERGIRTAANLGGGLFSGNRELQENRSRNEMAQSFANQDIALNDARRRSTVGDLQTLLQLAFPNVQNSTIGGSPDALYNALVANQGNYTVTSGIPGTPGFLSSLAGAFR